eukprot:COSAG06_NODE_33947_length_482_cov_0.676240_1_plen_52_part_10
MRRPPQPPFPRDLAAPGRMLTLLLTTLALGSAAANGEGDGEGHWQRGSHVQL